MKHVWKAVVQRENINVLRANNIKLSHNQEIRSNKTVCVKEKDYSVSQVSENNHSLNSRSRKEYDVETQPSDVRVAVPTYRHKTLLSSRNVSFYTADTTVGGNSSNQRTEQ